MYKKILKPNGFDEIRKNKYFMKKYFRRFYLLSKRHTTIKAFQKSMQKKQKKINRLNYLERRRATIKNKKKSHIEHLTKLFY